VEVTVERLPTGETTLRITVEQTKVAEAFKQAYRELRRDVEWPGFRRGRIPRPLLEAIIGREALAEYAKELIVNETYNEALREHHLLPLARPEVDVEQFEEDKPLVYEVSVSTALVELGDYRRVQAKRPRVQVTEEDVEQEYKNLWEGSANYRPAPHSHVQHNDVVIFSLRISRRGEIVDEYSEQDPLRVQIGHNDLRPSLDSLLLGMVKGQQKTAVVTYPEDFEDQELAGQQAEFQIKVLDILEKQLPSEEEFLKEFGDFKNPAELKKRIGEVLRAHREALAQDRAEEEVLQETIKLSRIEIPEDYLEERFEEDWEDFCDDLQEQGIELGEQEEEARRLVRERTENSLKREFVLEAAARAEDLQPTREDIINELLILARANQIDPEVLAKRLAEQEQIPWVARRARLRKARRMLAEGAQIVEVEWEEVPAAAPLSGVEREETLTLSAEDLAEPPKEEENE